MNLVSKISVLAASVFQELFRNGPAMIRPLVFRFTWATVNLKGQFQKSPSRKTLDAWILLASPHREGMGCLGCCSYPPVPGSVGGGGQREKQDRQGILALCWLLTTVVPGCTCLGAAWHVCKVCTKTKCTSQEFKGLSSTFCFCNMMVLQFKSGKERGRDGQESAEGRVHLAWRRHFVRYF